MHLIYVDTLDYSGNFEREMVAYATGCADERAPQEDLANSARRDMRFGQWWADNIVAHVGPEKEEACVANIAATPGWFNNGMGGHFQIGAVGVDIGGRHYPAYQSVSVAVRNLPPPEVWEEFQERVIDFCERVYAQTAPTWNPHRSAIGLTGVRTASLETQPKRRLTA